MYYLNLGLCILLLVGLVFEAYLVMKRNRTVKVKGNDDFFTVMIIIFFIMVVFPITNSAMLIESFRNMLLLLFVFSTFTIKRGISEKGFEKVFFTVPWDKITSIQISELKINYITVKAQTEKIKFKLIFHKFQLPMVLLATGNKAGTINIENTLIKK